MIRQALLGGSFDPVHNGHLHIAREILRSGSAESVVFFAQRPPQLQAGQRVAGL